MVAARPGRTRQSRHRSCVVVRIDPSADEAPGAVGDSGQDDRRGGRAAQAAGGGSAARLRPGPAGGYRLTRCRARAASGRSPVRARSRIQDPSVRANGVRFCRRRTRTRSSGRYPRAGPRARSSTSPALVTAGLGSNRNAPGAATGTPAPRRSHRRVPGAGRGGSTVARLVGRSPGPGTRAGLLQVPADGNELGLPARRDKLARQPGRGLDPDRGDASGQGQAPGRAAARCARPTAAGRRPGGQGR